MRRCQDRPKQDRPKQDRGAKRAAFSKTVLQVIVGGCLVASAAPALAAHQACDDPSHLCIVSGDEGARWEAGEKSTSKNRSRRSTKQGGKLSVDLEGGRASLFVNGRFRGNPPLQDIDVPSGKNDIQLRDGETILAEGLLTVPRNGSVSVVVHHPG